MSNKVYVGNLPYSFTNDDLRGLFAAFGAVRMAEVILDRETNRSRGFGFVEMDSAGGVQQVIQNLHDTELQGRRLTVTEARERTAGGPSGAPRSAPGPRFGGGGPGAPRPSGGVGGHGGMRPSGGVGGGPNPGRGGAAQRGGRPKRDENDRWSDGGGPGRRRRRDDDFGDE